MDAARQRYSRWGTKALGALGAGLVLAMFGVSARADEGEAAKRFEAEVRPILVRRCYECHSAESKELGGRLLLDRKSGWEKGGESGPAVVPGKPEESLLIRAIGYGDVVQMPPAGKLPEAEIAALTRWVAEGAFDPRTEAAPVAKPARVIDLEAERKHWAYAPLSTPAVPTPTQGDDAAGAIDRFLQVKLEAAGLKRLPEAERTTLARRAALDLWGIPPEPERVARFLADRRPDAYERYVDELLAHPRYGERWARYWLDLARFGESHGFEHDYDRPSAYTYRDYVIRALNEDQPYDEFVRWQLAGDELAPERAEALKATGFLAAGVHATQITANQVEKERYDELDDMLATTGSTFLGLTFGCARCHDHKFDPIPTNDYYRMLSVFTTTVRSEMELRVDPEGDARRAAAHAAAGAPLSEAQQAFERDVLRARFETWLTEPRSESGATENDATASVAWRTLLVSGAESSGGAKLVVQEDRSVRATENHAPWDRYTVRAATGARRLTGLRLEALPDPALVKKGPGRAGNGNFHLTDLQVYVTPTGGKETRAKLEFRATTFDQSEALAARLCVDEDPKSGWAVDPQFGRRHAATFAIVPAVELPEGGELRIVLKHNGNTHHALGRFRLAVTTAEETPGEGAEALDDAIVTLAERAGKPDFTPTDEERAQLFAWYRTRDARWRELNRAVEEHAARAPTPTIVKALVSSEGVPAVRLHTQGGDFLEQTHVLRRGDPNQKVEVARAGFLQVLMPTGSGPEAWLEAPPEGWRTSYQRRGLALWMTDVDRGAGALAARVIVNRLWQHHFGRGIVFTASDFGMQGTPPDHPELLEHLASDLVAGGWRLKRVHRAMMTSAAYRQAAMDERTLAADPKRLAMDPENALVSRFAPRRLEGEALRDALLEVSGRREERLYGPGTLELNQPRRSIYFTIKRSKLINWMTVFDAPEPNQSVGLRPGTTTAAQALALLNSPFVRRCADGMAEVAAGGEDQDETKIRRVFLRALGREPSEREQEQAVEFLKSQAARYSERGERESEAGRKALVDYCQVVLCLNEFAYIP
jgi:cytochrome c553